MNNFVQIARFGGLRIIVLTVLQAFQVLMTPISPFDGHCQAIISIHTHVQSMVFITVLLFTVTYIFAIAGVIFFESYSRSDRQDLVFHQSFRYGVIYTVMSHNCTYA